MSQTPAGARSSYGWRIGSLAGTPIYLARSWPVIAAVILALFGPQMGAATGSAVTGYVLAGVFAVLLLGSVLVHEAAHATAARLRGHPVERIVATVWGGHTVYDATRSSATTTALVAVVGPASNLLLAAAGWFLLPLVPDGTATVLVQAVTQVNLFVGIFNLLPGLPMDGGQIVSALVWAATGRRSTGLAVAGWLGRAVAVGLVGWVLLPFLEGVQPSLTQLLFAGLIAAFLWKGASDAISAGPLLEATSGPASDVLDPVVVAPAAQSVAELVRRAAHPGVPVVVVVTDAAGRPVGTLDADAAFSIPPERQEDVPVSAVYVSQPATWVVELGPAATVADLVRAMQASSLSVAAVVEAATGRVVGVARAVRLNEAIEQALARRRTA